MKITLVPQEAEFFSLFEESAKNIVATAHAIREMLLNWVDLPRKVEHINEFEHIGDNITHQVVALLHKSFITPLEREDISLLAQTMDDIVDHVHAATETMYIYQVESPTTRSQELAGILVTASEKIAEAIPLLRHRKETKRLMDVCIELNQLENEGDRVYRLALGEIFDTSRDAVYIIKWREIYEHLESALDRCEDVANILEGIALKAT
jgi:uncharacterized protein